MVIEIITTPIAFFAMPTAFLGIESTILTKFIILVFCYKFLIFLLSQFLFIDDGVSWIHACSNYADNLCGFYKD